jgi:hypothetical protein
MVLNHLAAILFFSGPLFWIGLLLAIAPGDVARLAPVRRGDTFRRIRTGVRFAGLALLLLAIAI